MNCPTCGKEMKKKSHGTYKCDNKDCKDKFIAAPLSIFGITQ
jgi:tRNA(Ile2) C34 agmatinyltransferase TiaS